MSMESINYVFIYGCHGKVYLEDHVVNVLAEEVEEDADAVVEAEDGDEVAVAEEVADEDEATAGEEATTKAAAFASPWLGGLKICRRDIDMTNIANSIGMTPKLATPIVFSTNLSCSSVK